MMWKLCQQTPQAAAVTQTRYEGVSLVDLSCGEGRLDAVCHKLQYHFVTPAALYREKITAGSEIG